MYYRRKIFLALLESFKGGLDSTDFEKLLFSYCKFSQKNFYDFFPYRFGCFSYISYQDKRILMEQGYLKDSDKFFLNATGTYLKQIKSEDQETMIRFSELYKGIRGNTLIKMTYKKYPEYTIKSEIAGEILNEEELRAVRESLSISDERTLFTIGYEGLTIDAYISKLIMNNIAVVIDVRKNPLSMKYGFSKTKLKSYLEKAGISYVHIPQLGIDSGLRKNLTSEDSYAELFEIYKKDILPENRSYIETVINLLQKYNRAALTCFEAKHNFCHRHKITEWLENEPWFKERIIHI